ncbi:hypothetical protein DL96DRAFT_1720720 [Flagelloscypha sp. PMI_526]|nr:hypothetical protein DL96DRAFT_1720720 [Flagelloscypha sp. PMI_526]
MTLILDLGHQYSYNGCTDCGSPHVLPEVKEIGNTRDRDLVTKIIRLTVETGTVTAIWSILIIILFFQKPPWFVIFADTIGKLYANSMMVMFNRRVNYSEQASTVHHQSMGTIAANTSSGGGKVELILAEKGHREQLLRNRLENFR